ncbi:MAG: transaldolase [Candidatus Omnitrophica bacterium CG11_big_fil_rev_8_21_14_0_20_45_26]|uniref:Transaldolase n=1 Tax=Candidatus Abzuiibacterium crystallinum TaxID=1974748 RepID=A0A2H0LLH4_9BACT|nr:MAG: transaldolase [Candidatus Omnitrophica bacterium CG11_big_fil_rev_8_21_14_0_20_45_26]PIW64497.1 MAG: transaldolase [Candidatus Omnitrophica bacterium CG12_big_fil_rev_8_21_14_0_65_45_16]
MAIFLDTAKIEDIQKFHRMGIIRGVTSNPTLLYQAGIVGTFDEMKKYFIHMAELIQPLPLSVEVTSNDQEEMIRQAKEFASWAKNINVKITIHGPQGELHNLEVVHHLEKDLNIRVNVTAMMSAQQCLVAAMAGASFVSLFCGRVNNMGYNAIDEIKKLRRLLDEFQLKAKIIAASTREILNVVEWLGAGAHIVTVLPNLLEGMIVHPYSKETVQMFLRDGERGLMADVKSKAGTV